MFGTSGSAALDALRTVYRAVYDLAVYEGRDLPTVATSLATAELTRLAANSFLATKISFINAMADVCDATGADLTALATGIGLDDRSRRLTRSGDVISPVYETFVTRIS